MIIKMISNIVYTSTCHICIQELEYDPKKIKKKCCDIKAFICNNCWDELTISDVNNCPICKKEIKMDEIILIESFQINGEVNTFCENKIKIIIILLSFETVGFITINLTILMFSQIYTYIVYIEEIKYLCKNIFFWFLCLVIGWFILCLIEFCTCFKIKILGKLLS